MANLMLESKAGGTWEYEVLESVEGAKEKVKVKYPIKKGFNEVPEEHIDTLEKDPGYQARVKNGTYKILKGGKAISAKKKDEKVVDNAKDSEEAKELFKKKIADLKEDHAAELKKEKDIYKKEYQKLIDSRGEALQKVKALEEEKVALVGKVSQLEAGTKTDSEILKAEIAGLNEDLEKQSKEHDETINALKIESEKQIKALEGENASLAAKVKDQATQIKNLKKK